jgi:hypothetical protein
MTVKKINKAALTSQAMVAKVFAGTVPKISIFLILAKITD